MPSNLSRRVVLLSAMGAALAPAMPSFALTTGQAESLIDRVVADINAVINSGQSEARMIAEFERIFSVYADVPIIARSALGVTARSASASQMARFTDAFQGYMARKYGKRFREFMGGRLEVRGAKPVKSFHEVNTTAFLQGRAPFDVTFLVSDRSGQQKFFNLFIEGVNMLASERTEIGAMLDRARGNVETLITTLKRAG